MSGVEVVTVDARLIAAVRRRTALDAVPKVLIPGLTTVWAAIREQGIAFGKNVAVYRDLGGGELEVLCGVEIADAFELGGELVCLETPAGTTARAIHTGPYRQLPQTYLAIARWMRERGLRAAGRSMEVYGDWTADEARLTTEVFVFLAGE